MKTISKTLFCVIVLFISTLSTAPVKAQDILPEDNETLSTTLTLKNPDPERGQRMPSLLLFCSISKVGGIQISGIENAEIVSFEILDAYGNTVALLQDEPSFIETIFSLNGEYRVVFRLHNCILFGWINI
ncbi:MAG: hypothetical protein K2G90_06900 [Muribaculaceae bacterium]|nr:hypothetical protein [Muribaculaceae bacterium]